MVQQGAAPDDDLLTELAYFEEAKNMAPPDEQVQIAQAVAESQKQFGIEFCNKELPCGHLCKGIKGESKCLGCFKNDCVMIDEEVALEPQDMMNGAVPDQNNSGIIGADETLLCGMCHVKEMGREPIAALSCRHAFHAGCIAKRLTQKWSLNKRISFEYLKCPICKAQMDFDYEVPVLSDQLRACIAEMTLLKQ